MTTYLRKYFYEDIIQHINDFLIESRKQQNNYKLSYLHELNTFQYMIENNITNQKTKHFYSNIILKQCIFNKNNHINSLLKTIIQLLVFRTYDNSYYDNDSQSNTFNIRYIYNKTSFDLINISIIIKLYIEKIKTKLDNFYSKYPILLDYQVQNISRTSYNTLLTCFPNYTFPYDSYDSISIEKYNLIPYEVLSMYNYIKNSNKLFRIYIPHYYKNCRIFDRLENFPNDRHTQKLWYELMKDIQYTTKQMRYEKYIQEWIKIIKKHKSFYNNWKFLKKEFLIDIFRTNIERISQLSNHEETAYFAHYDVYVYHQKVKLGRTYIIKDTISFNGCDYEMERITVRVWGGYTDMNIHFYACDIEIDKLNKEFNYEFK